MLRQNTHTKLLRLDTHTKVHRADTYTKVLRLDTHTKVLRADTSTRVFRGNNFTSKSRQSHEDTDTYTKALRVDTHTKVLRVGRTVWSGSGLVFAGFSEDPIKQRAARHPYGQFPIVPLPSACQCLRSGFDCCRRCLAARACHTFQSFENCSPVRL